MYYLTDFCSICFYNKEHLQLLSNTDSNNLTYFFKLTSCVAEMCFNGMNDQRFVCNKCCETLDTVYMFRQRCLKSKTTLTEYMSQLHQISKISGKVNVYLADINKFADIKKEFSKENIEKTEMFIKLNKDVDQEENFQIKPITEIKTEINPTSLKLNEPEIDNFIQLENVTIKMERVDENSEDDNILINQDENKIDISQNDVKIMANIKKENETQDSEDDLQKRFYNNWETCDSENDYMVTKEKENNDYSLYSKECTNDLSTNLDEVKVDIVDNNIESANEEINIKHKIEDIEKLSTEVNVIPLEDQVKDTADKEPNFIYKSLEGKQKQLSSIKMPKQQQKECGVTKQKNKMDAQFPQSSMINNEYDVSDKKIHTRIKQHECSVCQKKFLYPSSLKEHLKIHTGIKAHGCSVCKKKFTMSFHLERHMRTHTGLKPHECSVCQKKFTYSSTLKEHLTIHTGVKPYECEVCKKQFTQSFALKEHMKIHTGVKPHECDTCQKKFTRLSDLRRHRRIHTGVRPYECSVCQKKYTQASTLRKHMNLHMGIKPHECNVCPKKFTHLSSLKDHLKIHSGLRPHECSVCQKKFTGSSDVKRHMRIHTGIKPHDCSVCMKKFAHASTLVDHMKNHTGEDPHKCDICHQKFTLLSSLLVHKKIHILV